MFHVFFLSLYLFIFFFVLLFFIFCMAQQPLMGQGLLIIEASQSHLDTQHLVGFLWASDGPVTEICT